MDSDWNFSIKEINGINLDNYFVQQRSCNSAVFVHKRYLEKPVEEKVEKVKVKKEKKREAKQEKQDKCQQFSGSNNILHEKSHKNTCNNNSVLENTIKFAKNLVPLIIPDEDKSNIFYTIKTSKKRTDKKTQEKNFEHHDLAHVKEDPAKLTETYRKVKKESYSVRESISHSSNNTLDDLNINQSLCCTFSEMSEKKHHKKDKKNIKRSNYEQKFAISESFEAVATETVGNDAKIKIHLMNEKDKQFLSDTIKDPVLNAIRECILELNNNNSNVDITTMQKIVKYNSQKLDNILDKLTCIEKRLDCHEKKLATYEKYQCDQESMLNIHEEKLHTYKNRFDTHELKLDSHEMKLDSHELKLNSHAVKLGSYEEKINHEVKMPKHHPKLDSHPKEMAAGACERNAEVESKRVPQSKSQGSNIKSSTLEELGADLIEMEEDFSSEEELHQERLDRRSKSTVVLDLKQEKAENKKMEKLGGGEVPCAGKGTTSIGGKLERPNRIPARFCWTDTGRKS